MGDRRMFSRKVVCSDRFLDMPVSARELYFQLGMVTDDEGFVGNPRTVTRSCGATVDDLKTLAAKGFVRLFESGVLHVTDFSVSNTIRKDRMHKTIYVDEKRLLTCGDNQAATIPQPTGGQLVAICHPNLTQPNLTKPNQSKDMAAKRTRFTPPTLEEVSAYCRERGSSVDPQRFIDHYTANGWMVGRNHMKDWRATVRNWEARDKPKPSKGANEYAADF